MTANTAQPGESGRRERILIIKPSSLGDIVHALPALAALRAAKPQAYIAWLAARSFAPLLEGHDLLDDVIVFDRKRYGRIWASLGALRDFAAFVGRMRAERFDLVIDLQGLLRSGLLAWLSGARQRIGPADAREGGWLFYTRRIRREHAGVHAVGRNLAIVGAVTSTPPSPRPLLRVQSESAATAATLLAHAGAACGAVLIAPGARWQSKRWAAERWAELIDALQDGGERTVLVGAADEAELAKSILQRCRSRPIDLVGKTSLPVLLAVIEQSAGMICQDSGPMHLAAALRKPLVTLFGPTDPQKTGPDGPNARVLVHDVPCRPCLRRVCPLGHHACLAELAPVAVLKAWRDVRRPVYAGGSGPLEPTLSERQTGQHERCEADDPDAAQRGQSRA